MAVITATPQAFHQPAWAHPFYRGHALLAGVGFFLILTMMPTTAALLLDHRTVHGISVWVKPLKFQASLAVHLLTIAWLLQWLPAHRRDTALVRILAASMAVTALFEVGYIAHQASLGEASHYNLATAYNRVMYGLMGVGAVVLVGSAAMIGGLILAHGDRHDAMALAAGLGLVLGGVLGFLTGAALSVHGGHWVGGVASDAGGLAIFGWSRTGGDLRIAHFFGLHMMQALPLAVLAVRYAAAARWERPTVWGTATAGIALTLGTFIQARLGLPLF